MNALTEDIFRRRDDALDAAGDARGHLIRRIEEGEDDLAGAVADLTVKQAYAAWWTDVTGHIEHGGLDPVTALIRVRDEAHNTLLRGIRSHTCMHAHAQSLTCADAARLFYNDTATIDLDTITGRAPATTAASPTR